MKAARQIDVSFGPRILVYFFAMGFLTGTAFAAGQEVMKWVLR